MAYGQRRGNGNTTRLTGMFPMKSGKGFVGSLRPEDLQNLIELIKTAKGANKSITFFVWKNQPGKGPAISLSASLAQDRPSGSGSRRIGAPARPAPADDPFPEADDSLFGGESGL